MLTFHPQRQECPIKIVELIGSGSWAKARLKVLLDGKPEAQV